MNTVLFDLDGTLLPMDIEEFTQAYFKALALKMIQLGKDEKLVGKGLMAGTKAMIQNNRQQANEIVFWKAFEEATQLKREEMEEIFYDFYTHEFNDLGNLCPRNETMILAVKTLKQQGKRLFLTTNPLFPRIATEERIAWAGLDPQDFEVITTYENSSACKPSLAYYEEVLETYHIDKEDCMMVGNDSKEDGMIETLGIPLYLVTDCLIHREDTPLTSKWHGTSQEFLEFVKKDCQ